MFYRRQLGLIFQHCSECWVSSAVLQWVLQERITDCSCCIPVLPTITEVPLTFSLATTQTRLATKARIEFSRPPLDKRDCLMLIQRYLRKCVLKIQNLCWPMHYFLNFQGFQIILVDLKNFFNAIYAFACKENTTSSLCIICICIFTIFIMISVSGTKHINHVARLAAAAPLTPGQYWAEPSNSEPAALQHCSPLQPHLVSLATTGNTASHSCTCLQPTSHTTQLKTTLSACPLSLSWWTTCSYCVQSSSTLFSTTLHYTCLQSVV